MKNFTLKKRLLTFLIILTMFAVALSATVLAIKKVDAEGEVVAPVEILPEYTWYGDGTANEFTIESKKDLVGLSNITNGKDGKTKFDFAGKTVKLGANISFENNEYWYFNDGATNYDYRIGAFAGAFDGQGNKISNLKFYHTTTADPSMYLFSTISAGGSVSGLTLDKVSANINDRDVFGFIALTLNGTATNCHVETAKVLVNVESGGTTGYARSSGAMFGTIGATTVTNCSASNVKYTLTGTDNSDNVGALIGIVSGNSENRAQITNCSVSDVLYDCTRKTKRTGGFVGISSYADYIDCTATRVTFDIDSYYQSVGGFVGSSSNSTFTNCDVVSFTVTCGVEADYAGDVGGFAGSCGSNVTFSSCDVTELDMNLISDGREWGNGGLIGWQEGGNVIIEDAYVSGDITVTLSTGEESKNFTGGLIGYSGTSSSLAVTGTTVDADVSSTGAAGGFVGYGCSGTFTDCTANGSVFSNDVAGGFWGEIETNRVGEDITITGCEANGEVLGENYSSGFIGTVNTYGEKIEEGSVTETYRTTVNVEGNKASPLVAGANSSSSVSSFAQDVTPEGMESLFDAGVNTDSKDVLTVVTENKSLTMTENGISIPSDTTVYVGDDSISVNGDTTLGVTSGQLSLVNEWVDEIYIDSWIYGDTASQPIASAKFGEVVFSYYDKDKNLLDSKPSQVGEYFVKATVEANGDSYAKIESNYFGFSIKAVVATIGDKRFADLKLAFADLVANGGTIELAEGATIDLTGVDWGQVNINKATVIEGNGAIIIGLNRPLVMNSTVNLTIRNLTIRNAVIVGFNSGNCNVSSESTTAGGFVAYVTNALLDNCNLISSSVTSNDYSGGLIGYHGSGTVVVSNCTVENCSITGGSSTGGMVGHSNSGITVSGSVSGNVITSTNPNPEGWQGVIFGVLTGSGTNAINVVESGASATDNDCALYLIGGRLASVEFTGGSYLSNPMDKGPNQYDGGTSEAIFTGSNGIVEEDGAYVIGAVDYVASILDGDDNPDNDQKFTAYSLKNAFKQLGTSGGTLQFFENVQVDLTNIHWTEITVGSSVTIKGNGATIIGLNRTLIAHVTSTVRIENLTIKNSNVAGYPCMHYGPVGGAFAGCVGSSVSVLENCHVLDCTITSGKYTGGLVGYANSSSLKIISCSVKNTTIKGTSVGGMVGHAAGDIFVSGRISGNTVESDESYLKEGALIGTVNANPGSKINVVEEEESTGKLTDVNSSPLYVIGRLYHDVTYVGGSYFTNPTMAADVSGGTSVAPYVVENGKYVIAVAIIDTTDDGQVNGQYFLTLGQAIETAQAGQTITLWQNVEENVSIDKNITIDLGAHTLTAGVTITSDALLTIKGSSVNNQITLESPAREHYWLEGWYTDAGLTPSNKVAEGAITTANVDGTSYYANWVRSIYEADSEALDFSAKVYGESFTAQTVTFSYDGNGQRIISAISESQYFTVSSNELVVTFTPKALTVGSYRESVTLTLPDGSISVIDLSITVTKAQVAKPTNSTVYTYTGSEQTYELASSSLYTISGNTRTDAGAQTVTVSLNDTANYEWVGGGVDDLEFNFEIQKANYDMSGISFANGVFTYDGSAKSIAISGTLPTGVSVQYSSNNSQLNATKNPVTVTASFTGDSANYNAIEDMTATITINPKAVTPTITITTPADEIVYNGREWAPRITAWDGETAIPITEYTRDFTNNTNAGTATVTIKDIPNGNYIVATVSANFEIQKANYDMSGISFANGQFTYDGNAHGLTISGTLPTGLDRIQVTVSYSGTATNVSDGEVTVTATFATTSTNYNAPTAKTAKVKINAKDITNATITLGAGLTYTGSEQTQAITSVVVDGLTVTYATSGDKQTNAGNYELTITGNGNFTGTATKTWNITKADAVITVDTTAIVKTYGESFTLPAATSNFGTVVCDKTITDLVNAGTYTVTYTVAGTTNYNGDTKTVSVTINKAQISKPTADTTTFTYTGSAQTYTVATNNAYTVTGNTRTEAGNYIVTVSLVDKNNYEWANDNSNDLTYAFNIAKKEIGLSWTAPASLVYNGLAKAPTVSATGVASGDTVNVTIALTASNQNVNVGAFTYTATGLDNENYKLPANVTSESYTIIAKDITNATITLGAGLTYTGSQQTQTITSVVIDGLTVTYATSGDKQTNAGSYELTITGNGNFTGTATKAWSIAKASYDMSGISFDDKEVKADGQAHGVEIVGNLPNGVTVEYSNNGKTEAGVYVVIATFTGDVNYNQIEAMTATLTINRAQIVGELVDENGKVMVVATSQSGFAPKVELIVREVGLDQAQTGDVLKDNERLARVISIELSVDGNVVQPEEEIVIKLLIPEEIGDRAFRVVRNHEGAFSDEEFTVEDGYAIISVDKLSEFLIIYDDTANLLDVMILIAGIIAVEVILAVVLLVTIKKKTNTGK